MARTVPTALYVALHGQFSQVALVFSILKMRELIIREQKTSYSVSEKQRQGSNRVLFSLLQNSFSFLWGGLSPKQPQRFTLTPGIINDSSERKFLSLEPNPPILQMRDQANSVSCTPSKALTGQESKLTLSSSTQVFSLGLKGTVKAITGGGLQALPRLFMPSFHGVCYKTDDSGTLRSDLS